MEKRRQPEIIAGRVNPDGSIATGDGFTVQRLVAGSYLITFASGFRLVSITATFNGGLAAINAFLGGFSERGVTVGMTNSAGTQTDAAFSFIAAGIQQ